MASTRPVLPVDPTSTDVFGDAMWASRRDVVLGLDVECTKAAVDLQNLNAGKFAFVALEMAMGGMQSERLNQLLREHVEPIEIVAGQEQTVTPKYFTGQEVEKLALAYLRGETR